MTTSDPAQPLAVRPVSAEEHRDFIAAAGRASFLQTPAWGQVKTEWRAESLGWFADASSSGSSTPPTAGPGLAGPGLGGRELAHPELAHSELVGVGLVLYRQLPRLKRYLAYLPEGPVIDWDDDDLARWLDPMVAHLKGRGAFGVRMGPPVITRTWSAAQVKDGMADEACRRLTDLAPADRSRTGAGVLAQLGELGWRPQAVEGGFAAGQPQFNFQIPLVEESGEPRTEDDVLAGMNQQWRRNIRKAAKSGVEVTRGGRADLPVFHTLYTHTAERDGFTPRPISYFETMHDALVAEDPDRFALWLARHEGDLVAATIGIRVGTHTWYSYGASSSEKRDVRGSNAVQWEMIRDALAAGAHVYDLRGITDTLDADDPHVGLIRFKVGTGGQAVEYAGEWDLPVNRALYAAFAAYLRRRG